MKLNLTSCLFLVAAGLLVVAVSVDSYSCDVKDQKFRCRIHVSRCLCGIGCPSEYLYPSKEDCTKALTGKAKNPCSSNPCLNGGACTQAKENGYKCRCELTGYYGPRCQSKCPTAGTLANLRSFPYECVVI